MYLKIPIQITYTDGFGREQVEILYVYRSLVLIYVNTRGIAVLK